MYCTKDCNCSLCRELRGFKPIKPPKKPAPRPPTSSIFGRLNENFILRRRGSSSLKTFQPQSLKCSEMCQQRDMGHIYDFCKRQTNTPSPTPVTQVPLSSSPVLGKDKAETQPKPNHKVVIYFGDSLAYRGNKSTALETNTNTIPITPEVLEKAKENLTSILPSTTELLTNNSSKQLQNEVITGVSSGVGGDSETLKNDDELPPYIESVENGVINIKIEGNYQTASELVEKVSKPTQALVGRPKDLSDDEEVEEEGEEASDDGEVTSEPCDWSFVQEWRAR